jgi:hypothetical protein
MRYLDIYMGRLEKLLTGFSHLAWAILYINTLIILVYTRVFTCISCIGIYAIDRGGY